MRMTVRFEGGRELAAALASLKPRVSTRIQREVLRDVAEPLRAQMGALAPRAPGAPDLADNMVISASRKSDTRRPTEVGVRVGPARLMAGAYSYKTNRGTVRTVGSSFYAYFLEFGTTRMPARPFMRPAFDRWSSGALANLARRLWVELAGRGIQRTGASGGGVSGGPGGRTL